MRQFLLIVCFSGLAYCVIQMIAIAYEFIRYYRMFKFVSISFNVQYQVLREYIKTEMSAHDVIQDIMLKDPENLEVVAFKDSITVLYVKGSSIECNNTTEIRDAFLKSGTLIEMLKEYFQLHNLVFVEGIYEENDEFFEELKRVRKSKGEPTEFSIDEELKKLEEEKQ